MAEREELEQRNKEMRDALEDGKEALEECGETGNSIDCSICGKEEEDDFYDCGGCGKAYCQNCGDGITCDSCKTDTEA